MDLFVAVAEYKKQLKVRGYAQSTIGSYTHNLDLFKRYLQDNELLDLRKVTHQVIVDYQQKVIAEPIGMESKAHKIRPVKRLFEYLTETHRLLINPTEGIVETSRKNRKPGTVISVDEMTHPVQCSRAATVGDEQQTHFSAPRIPRLELVQTQRPCSQY